MPGTIRRGRIAIEEASQGGIQKLLDRLAERGFDPEEQSKGWLALCPVHGDTNPSLAINEGENGQVLIYCLSHQCEFNDILDALDLEARDLGGTGKTTTRKKNIEYVYVNANGEPVRKVVRKPNKEFPQAWWNGDEWVWKDVAKNVPLLLYRLPEVLAAVEKDEIIYVAEGERDVDSLVKAGVTATCNPGGAGKWTDDLSIPLEGAGVVVVADRDEAGYKHAYEVAASLRKRDCDVLIVEAKAGKDPDDHLRVFGVDDFVAVEEIEILPGERYGSGDFPRAIQSYLDKATRGKGPSFGFPELDNYFYGQRGVTIYLGAPKSLKSWLLVKGTRENIYTGNYPWLFSLELPAEETYMRLMCMITNIPWWKYIRNALSPIERQSMKELVEELETSGSFEIVKPPPGERSIDDLVSQAKKAGAGVVFIDQLQYVEVDGRSLGDWNETGRYFGVLDHARNFSDEIPICFAHQFNRTIMGASEMPVIEQAKASNAVGETATQVLGIWASKEMRESSQFEIGTLASRNHNLCNWSGEVNLTKECRFDIIGVAENDG